MCNLLLIQINLCKKEKNNDKKDLIIQSIFESKLLENISIIKENDNNNFKNKLFDNLKNIINFENYNFIEKKLDLIKRKDSINEENDYNQIILNLKNNYYKIIFDVFEKILEKKYVWGKIKNKELKPILEILYTIVLKHCNLLGNFDSFYLKNKNLFENNETQINKLEEISDFKIFFDIYVLINNIKQWFNTSIKEKFDNKQNNDDKINSDELISNYLKNLYEKSEFILNHLKFKNISLNKNMDYIYDIINNLLLYIKTDEIAVEYLIKKIDFMNNYAIKKENSLLILNIIFSLLKNESDLIDVIFFYIKIIKG